MGFRVALLVAFATISLALTLCLDPILQNPAYHDFADQRPLLGIPHLLNVASNLPFLGVGAWGLCHLWGRRSPAFTAAWERWPYAFLLGSIFLTGIGSGYYHSAPANETLFWDRLPLALTFSSFLGIMLIERVDMKWGAWLFLPLLAAGAGSLVIWQVSGDLRFYGLLQGWALLGVPLIILLFPSRYAGTGDLAAIVALYAVAKAFEFLDVPVYRLGEWVSGHTLKHLTASLATWRIWKMLRRR
jgi:hypothetical protein